MKSIHRLFSRFDIVSAMALILLFSSGADAATLGRLTSRVTFLPPRAVLAFRVPIPQPLALHPALIRIGTPVQDCRDFSNLDRAIEACTRVNASKNLAKRTRSIALSNRCSAYQLKGMTDKAIMDCDRRRPRSGERGGLLQSRPGGAQEGRPCPGYRGLQRGDTPLAALLERLRQVLQQRRFFL